MDRPAFPKIRVEGFSRSAATLVCGAAILSEGRKRKCVRRVCQSCRIRFWPWVAKWGNQTNKPYTSFFEGSFANLDQNLQRLRDPKPITGSLTERVGTLSQEEGKM